MSNDKPGTKAVEFVNVGKYERLEDTPAYQNAHKADNINSNFTKNNSIKESYKRKL